MTFDRRGKGVRFTSGRRGGETQRRPRGEVGSGEVGSECTFPRAALTGVGVHLLLRAASG